MVPEEYQYYCLQTSITNRLVSLRFAVLAEFIKGTNRGIVESIRGIINVPESGTSINIDRHSDFV